MSKVVASTLPHAAADAQAVTGTQVPTTTATNSTPRTKRVLACVSCQQRKVKCDRQWPCANCLRSGVDCVYSNSTRPRRRRFPERELLDRLRHYEGLLRASNIAFEPLHGPTQQLELPVESGQAASPDDKVDDINVLDETGVIKSKNGTEGPAAKSRHEAADLFNAISRVSLGAEDDDDGVQPDRSSETTNPEAVCTEECVQTGPGAHHSAIPHRDATDKNSWSQAHQSEETDHLIFGTPIASVDLCELHPGQVQILQLWQVYLENVNPLLKVTHAPTLQARIIDAVSHPANLPPTLQALMFSIYCVAIMSLSEDDCHATFGTPRRCLLGTYQFACQQALFRCRFWRCDDVDALVALYLYLISVRSSTDPRSLSSALAVAIRNARRMGLHDKSSYAKHTVLESEIRCRVWWSLVLLDQRVCEISDYRATTLVPIWECRTPSNLSDFELRPEMNSSPAFHDRPTDALFIVVRTEMADFIRHTQFHLDFVNPTFNHIARANRPSQRPTSEGSEVTALETMIEEKYLAHCDPDDPLHFMTIWVARGYIARNRLLEYYSRHSKSAGQQTDSQRSAALTYALSMLDCDTKLRNSPLTKRYLLLFEIFVPALAYTHILNHIRRRPLDPLADKAWGDMRANWQARTAVPMPTNKEDEKNGLVSFSRVVLPAWTAWKEALTGQGQIAEMPRIVADLRDRVRQTEPVLHLDCGLARLDTGVRVDGYSLSGPTPTQPGGGSDGVGQEFFPGPGRGGHSGMLFPVPGMMDVEMEQFWAGSNWDGI